MTTDSFIFSLLISGKSFPGFLVQLVFAVIAWQKMHSFIEPLMPYAYIHSCCSPATHPLHRKELTTRISEYIHNYVHTDSQVEKTSDLGPNKFTVTEDKVSYFAMSTPTRCIANEPQ